MQQQDGTFTDGRQIVHECARRQKRPCSAYGVSAEKSGSPSAPPGAMRLPLGP